jgi:hypothetical protein
MSRQQPSSTQQDLHAATRAPWARFLILVVVIYIATVITGGLALLYSPAARAEPRLEALGGVCDQTRSDKGSWWNDHYETSIDLTTRCYQIGVSDRPWTVATYPAGWRIAYVNLGRITTDSVMAARDEDQFSNPSGAHCNPSTNAGCLIRTVGGGTAYGLSAGLLLEDKLDEQATAGIEAGLLVYHNEFKIAMYRQPGGEPYARWNEAEGWLATPYIGANLRYGWLLLSGRMYQRITAHKVGCVGGCSGITKGPALQVNAGVSIPF